MKRERYLQDDELIINDKYKVKGPIGAGMYGQVYLCSSKENNFQDQVAVKVLPKQDFLNQPELHVFLKRETEICSKLKHKNICNFIEFSSDKKFYYIVQEYCKLGNLAQRIYKTGIQIEGQKYRRLSEEQALVYMKQIIKAFEYIHTRPNCDKIVIHRDIKLENIFIAIDENNEEVSKIGDFGFARESVKEQLVNTYLGSPYTQAPELSYIGKYDERSDIYSLGVIFYQMLFGTFPFKPGQIEEQNKPLAYNLAIQAKTQKINFNLFNITISDDMKDLLKSMITFGPKERIIFQKLFRHKFFKSQESVIYQQIGEEQKQNFDEQLQKLERDQSNAKNIDRISIFAMVLAEKQETSLKFIKEYLEDETQNVDPRQLNKRFTSTFQNHYKEFTIFRRIRSQYRKYSKQHTKVKFINQPIFSREKDFFIILVDCDKEDQDEDNQKDILDTYMEYIFNKASGQKQDKLYGTSLKLWTHLQEYGLSNDIIVKKVDSLQDQDTIHKCFLELIEGYNNSLPKYTCNKLDVSNNSFSIKPQKLNKPSDKKKSGGGCC